MTTQHQLSKGVQLIVIFIITVYFYFSLFPSVVNAASAPFCQSSDFSFRDIDQFGRYRFDFSWFIEDTDDNITALCYRGGDMTQPICGSAGPNNTNGNTTFVSSQSCTSGWAEAGDADGLYGTCSGEACAPPAPQPPSCDSLACSDLGGGEVRCTGRASDPNNNLDDCWFHWGDGHSNHYGLGCENNTRKHTYSSSGTYQIQYEVMDTTNKTDSCFTSMTINVQGPTLTPTSFPTPTGGPGPTPTPGGPTSTPPPPSGRWFQTYVGDVHSQGSITSNVPSGNYFCKKDSSIGDSGLVSYKNLSSNFGSGRVSETNNSWNINQADFPREENKYGYNYYKNKFSSPASFGNTLQGVACNTVNGVYTVTGDLTVGSTCRIDGGRKVIFLVSRNLNVNNKVEVANNSFLAFIVSGNVQIANNRRGSLSNPDVQGVFIADGQIKTGSGSNQLYAAGMFIGWGGFDLQRRTGTGLKEVFIYRPDLLVNMPKEMKEEKVSWREVAP